MSSLTVLILQIVFVVIMSILMYLGGEITRSLFMNFGYSSKGFSRNIYNQYRSPSDESLTHFSVFIVKFSTPARLFQVFEEFKKGDFDISSFWTLIIQSILLLVQAYLIVWVVGWLGLAVMYLCFFIGFVRSHYANKKYQETD